jgi:hypothetical protein
MMMMMMMPAHLLKRSENARIEQACGAGIALKETKESATGPGDGLSTDSISTV